MSDPITNAVRGKGFLPMLERAQAISTRYGFPSRKMEEALSSLVGILERFGGGATVPVTANALSRHPRVVRELRARGIVFAIHGLEHVDYSLLSFEQQLDHIQRAKSIFEETGVAVAGFRSPYLRWNKNTIRALHELRFDYDSSQALAWGVNSITANAAYQHALDFYGAQPASLYPALPHLEGNLVRIPYCLPDDEALIERLKLAGSPRIAETWLEMLDRIYAAGELFTLGLHPERVPLCQTALTEVLKKARAYSPPVWITTLEEIASWYRSLGKATFVVDQKSEDSFYVTITAPPQARILARLVEVETPTTAWGQDYRVIPARAFTFHCAARPWIGLSPECPPSLARFLRHQGYLVETSLDCSVYSFSLQQKTFRPEDERPLLTKLETYARPLIRLGRWPDGAQAVLAVTGDIDAFTLWDYGLRVFSR